jgi:trimethylamine:corrinoid methyltransferase-like protein
MTVSTLVKIGQDQVDITKPCDVALALRKIELTVTTGNKSETIELGGEKVTFTRANASRLAGLIRHYEDQCRRSTGRSGRRAARSVRWVR